MQFKDISTDTATHYRLAENEQCVFFMWNRGGDITLELSGPNAQAHVFAFFIGKKSEQRILTISQKHLAPKTVSRVLVKSILHHERSFSH